MYGKYPKFIIRESPEGLKSLDIALNILGYIKSEKVSEEKPSSKNAYFQVREKASELEELDKALLTLEFRNESGQADRPAWYKEMKRRTILESRSLKKNIQVFHHPDRVSWYKKMKEKTIQEAKSIEN
jgi:ribosomal protein L29